MIPALNTAAGAVRSAHDRIAQVAHNVANLNTPGFEPNRPVAPPEEADSELELPREQTGSPEDAPSKVELAREVANQIQAEAESRANLRLIHSLDETLGTVIDLLA